MSDLAAVERLIREGVTLGSLVGDILVGGADFIRGAKLSLYALAKQAMDKHWQIHQQENRGLKPWDKSILCARIVGSPDKSFYIEWYWNKWHKDKAGRYRPLSKHIKKGKGFAYPDSTLKRFAKDWELERVLEAEGRFAAIRQELRDIKRIELVLGQVRRRWSSGRSLDDDGVCGGELDSGGQRGGNGKSFATDPR